MRCSRCGTPNQGVYEWVDICTNCGKVLCVACLAEGCCGKVPAESSIRLIGENEVDDDDDPEEDGT